MHRTGGFTLIELLVVIGIIAVLAALAFPVFRGVVGGSRRACCGSNLRQVALAASVYAGRYDGSLPKYEGWTRNPRQVYSARCLRLLVPAYVDAGEVFNCPDTEDRIRSGFRPDVVDFTDPDCRFDDAMGIPGGVSVECSYGIDPWRGIDGRRRPLVADRPETTMGPAFFGSENVAANSPNHGRQGQNVAFVDGSLQWLEGTVLSDGDDLYRGGGPDAVDACIVWDGY